MAAPRPRERGDWLPLAAPRTAMDHIARTCHNVDICRPASALPLLRRIDRSLNAARVRPHHMAVRTDEVAFCDLIKDSLPVASSEVATDSPEFDHTWSVVPLHGLWWVDLAAVKASSACLQRKDPMGRDLRRGTSHDARFSLAEVPSAVDLGAARFADRLMPVAASAMQVELPEGFDDLAARAALHLLIVHAFDIEKSINEVAAARSLAIYHSFTCGTRPLI